MSRARRVVRRLVLVVLLLGVAAMHTQMPGACPSGMSTSGLGMQAVHGADVITGGSQVPGPADAGVNEVCQATVPPIHSAVAAGPAAVLLPGLTPENPSGPAPSVLTGPWHPPPQPRASFGIWRI